MLIILSFLSRCTFFALYGRDVDFKVAMRRLGAVGDEKGSYTSSGEETY